MYKYLLLIIVFLICFGCYTFVQAQVSLGGEEKTVIGGVIETFKENLKKALVIWKETHQKVMAYWKENILPKIQQWFEEKKPIIKKEFEEEKEELKKGLSKTFSELWQWVKDLIR